MKNFWSICILLELISFWYVLIEIPAQLSQIWKNLSLDVKQRFESNLTFRWLLFQQKNQDAASPVIGLNKLSGPVQACQPLIHALIKSYLDEGMTIDTLCVRLRQNCPQLFSAEDSVAANALELLQQAHHSMITEGTLNSSKMASMETQQQLNKAIQLLLQVASSINLTAISQTVKACGAHDGLLKICLEASQSKDPHNHAKYCSPVYQHVQSRTNSKMNYSVNEDIAQTALDARYECYRVALSTLDDVINIIDGKPDVNYPEDFTAKVELLWKHSLNSKDPLWHYALYDYLNDKPSQRHRLTRLDTSYIQNWFDYVAESNPEKNALLYGQWLEGSERYADAAKILYRLSMLDSVEFIERVVEADKTSVKHNLVFKIELLSRALVNAKASADPELVSEVSDRMDVAEVQQTVVKLLRQKAESNQENIEIYTEGIEMAERRLLQLRFVLKILF